MDNSTLEQLTDSALDRHKAADIAVMQRRHHVFMVAIASLEGKITPPAQRGFMKQCRCPQCNSRLNTDAASERDWIFEPGEEKFRPILGYRAIKQHYICPNCDYEYATVEN